MSSQEVVTVERPQDAFTIGEFFPLQHRREDIYLLGSSALEETGGVPLEQAAALGFSLDPVPNDENLSQLTGVLGKSKDLQENVAGLKLRLGDRVVDGRYGTGLGVTPWYRRVSYAIIHEFSTGSRSG